MISPGRLTAPPVFLAMVLAGALAAPAQDVADPATPEITRLSAERLAEELAARRGKVVLLNMWATWCPPCVAEFPYLVEFGHQVDPDEVAIMAISADFDEDLETQVYPFLADQQPPFPIFLQDEHEDIFLPAVDPDWTGVFPHTVVYDAEGQIVTTTTLFHSAEELRGMVAQAMSPEAAVSHDGGDSIPQ